MVNEFLSDISFLFLHENCIPRIPLRRGLSYDDVLLKPQKTDVTSLSSVDTSVEIAGLELTVPAISAPMDTVTEAEMAKSMAMHGGLGVIHRFMPAEEQVKQVREVKNQKTASSESTTKGGDLVVGAAVGLNDMERTWKLVDAGTEVIVMDIAHGHHSEMLRQLENLSESFPEPVIVAGNVATGEAAEDLADAGADVVKVGIGPGSACTTREMTGAGVPQFTAVRECFQAVDAPVIADGGIKKPGCLMKALVAGADAGMMGGMFAGTDEAPGEVIEKNGKKYKRFRGMSSTEAAEERSERENREKSYSDTFSEGTATDIEYKGSLQPIMNELAGGLRSGISYCGASDLEKARENAEFIQTTGSTQYRNGAHIK